MNAWFYIIFGSSVEPAKPAEQPLKFIPITSWVIFWDSSTSVLKELHMPHETDPFAPSKPHLCKMILRAMRRESFTGGWSNDPISGNTASSQSGSEPARNCCSLPVLQENDSGFGRTGKRPWNRMAFREKHDRFGPSGIAFPGKSYRSDRKLPDCDYIRREMGKSGVTLSLLWHEYCEEYRTNGELPLMYSQFCRYYRKHDSGS